MRTQEVLERSAGLDPHGPPNELQLIEIEKLLRLRDAAVSWPSTAAEASAEIRRLWAL